MRLGINTVKFTGNLTDLKKFIEKKFEEEEELAKLMEEKDKEDEFMWRHQEDNMSFSG